jgi:regulatory LuxR family protein
MRSSSGPDPRTGGTERGRLSDREFDVVALISEGFSNTEISIALKIGEPTVKKHVGVTLDQARAAGSPVGAPVHGEAPVAAAPIRRLHASPRAMTRAAERPGGTDRALTRPRRLLPSTRKEPGHERDSPGFESERADPPPR